MVTTVIDETYADQFDRLIAQGVRNTQDIASHYNFNPERLRLFRNGSREFVQYNDIAQFTDAVDHYKLQPDASDSMHIESAESATYVVNYVMQASWAFALNQSLADGDVLRVGPYNGTDGWLLEQRGADHTDTQADIIESSGGTETTLVSNIDLPRPTTDWQRLECTYGWYSVLNQIWRLSYTDDGNVINDTIATTSRDGARGPQTGNLNLWMEIQASASTTGLELEAGSMGNITIGDPTTLARDKPQRVDVTLDATDDTWLPIYAVRIDPDNPNVNVSLTQVTVLSYDNATDLELVAANMSPDKTDATGFDVPGYHHAQNSALQSTTNISQVPDDTGTQTTLTSTDKFGGYTLAAAQIVSGGNTVRTDRTASTKRLEKKFILNSDETVFLARTSNAGALLRFIWDADQNW